MGSKSVWCLWLGDGGTCAVLEKNTPSSNKDIAVHQHTLQLEELLSHMVHLWPGSFEKQPSEISRLPEICLMALFRNDWHQAVKPCPSVSSQTLQPEHDREKYFVIHHQYSTWPHRTPWYVRCYIVLFFRDYFLNLTRLELIKHYCFCCITTTSLWKSFSLQYFWWGPSFQIEKNVRVVRNCIYCVR